MILAQNWPTTAKSSWQCPFKAGNQGTYKRPGGNLPSPRAFYANLKNIRLFDSVFDSLVNKETIQEEIVLRTCCTTCEFNSDEINFNLKIRRSRVI